MPDHCARIDENTETRLGIYFRSQSRAAHRRDIIWVMMFALLSARYANNNNNNNDRNNAVCSGRAKL